MLSRKVINMKLFVGIDVSKHKLDAYYNGNYICVANSTKGLIKLNKLFKKEVLQGNEIALITCEATGGYEKKLVDFMFSNKLPIHTANPLRVRRFAESKGLFAKTDKIDAQVIAEYSEIMKPEADSKLRTAEENSLAEKIKRRDQLIGDKTREGLRLDKELSPETKKSIKSHIKWLDKEIGKIEEAIKNIQKNELINKKFELLTSIPAIGKITAMTLIAYLPELGKYDKKKLAALVGLAPFARESGKYKGMRFIRAGRGILRKALYMAALSAVRHYKEMKELYSRLRTKGKAAKLALIAVARKLLHVANSVMQRQSIWKETYPRVTI